VSEHPLVPPGWLEWVARRPADGSASGADWAGALPRLLEELLADWDLTPAGPGLTGATAVVVPVDRDGEPLALKVVWPHRVAAGEHLALRHWAGRGAVRLVAADPGRGALLLERLDPTCDLRDPDIDTACAVIGGLLGRLHIPAPPNVRTLSSTVRRHLPRLTDREDVPRRIATRVAGLADDLLAEPGVDATLLHADLHFENVLAAEREPWLAIDPKPMAGHPAFEIQPVLRNRVDELGTGSAFRWGIRRRVSVTCEAAGIDEELGRLWSIVHTGIQAGWAAEAGDGEALSLHIATLKALED
jgi:streptomycin 6-kinase